MTPWPSHPLHLIHVPAFTFGIVVVPTTVIVWGAFALGIATAVRGRDTVPAIFFVPPQPARLNPRTANNASPRIAFTHLVIRRSGVIPEHWPSQASSRPRSWRIGMPCHITRRHEGVSASSRASSRATEPLPACGSGPSPRRGGRGRGDSLLPQVRSTRLLSTRHPLQPWRRGRRCEAWLGRPDRARALLVRRCSSSGPLMGEVEACDRPGRSRRVPCGRGGRLLLRPWRRTLHPEMSAEPRGLLRRSLWLPGRPRQGRLDRPYSARYLLARTITGGRRAAKRPPQASGVANRSGVIPEHWPRPGSFPGLGNALLVVPRLVLLTPLRLVSLRLRELPLRFRSGLRVFGRGTLSGNRSATCDHEGDNQQGHGDQSDDEPWDHAGRLSGQDHVLPLPTSNCAWKVIDRHGDSLMTVEIDPEGRR